MRFFTASGVGRAQDNQDQFCFRRATLYSKLKSNVGIILAKSTALRINLNIDVAPNIFTRTHSPIRAIPLSNLSPPFPFPFLRYPLPPLHLVCARF